MSILLPMNCGNESNLSFEPSLIRSVCTNLRPFVCGGVYRGAGDAPGGGVHEGAGGVPDM